MKDKKHTQKNKHTRLSDLLEECPQLSAKCQTERNVRSQHALIVNGLDLYSDTSKQHTPVKLMYLSYRWDHVKDTGYRLCSYQMKFMFAYLVEFLIYN